MKHIAPIIVALCALAASGQDMGTAFVYQGHLTNGGQPTNGLFEIQSYLYKAAVGGAVLAADWEMNVPVSNGYFSVVIDFDSETVFGGDARYLELRVRHMAEPMLVTLSPRQELKPVPYALCAASVRGGGIDGAAIQGNAIAGYHITDGTLTGADIWNGSIQSVDVEDGTITGDDVANGAIGSAEIENGAILSMDIAEGAVTTIEILDGTIGATDIKNGSIASGHIQDGTISGGDVAGGTLETGHLDVGSFGTTFWKADGNAGTTAGTHFLGTIDNLPLDLRAGNTRGLRLQPGSPPSLIGGDVGNAILQTDGAFIGGGEENAISTNSTGSVIGGGRQNTIAQSTYQAFIGSGYQNDIGVDSDRSAVAGGWDNGVAGASRYAFIGAGFHNDIGSGSQAGTVAGGGYNDIGDGSPYGAIGGGFNNEILAGSRGTTIPGGEDNFAAGDWSLAAGQQANATNDGTFVWADSQDAPFGSTATDQFLVRAVGGVGIGTATPVAPLDVVGAGADVFNHNTDALVARFMHENPLYGAEISICGRGGRSGLEPLSFR